MLESCPKRRKLPPEPKPEGDDDGKKGKKVCIAIHNV